MGSIGFCDSLSHWVQPPDAEYGVSVKLKPHVRWCGRGNELYPLPRPDLTLENNPADISIRNSDIA